MTKEEYIKWRTEWKAGYKTLSEEIRNTKHNIKVGMKIGEAVYKIQWRIIKLKDEATRQLDLRKQSKLDAQASYLSAKEKGVKPPFPYAAFLSSSSNTGGEAGNISLGGG